MSEKLRLLFNGNEPKEEKVLRSTRYGEVQDIVNPIIDDIFKRFPNADLHDLQLLLFNTISLKVCFLVLDNEIALTPIATNEELTQTGNLESKDGKFLA